MISFRNIFTIFKKEFLQLMRDKSVLFTNFFIPLFGIPLYFLGVYEFANQLYQKESKPLIDSTIFKYSVIGEVPKTLSDKFKTDEKLQLIDDNKGHFDKKSLEDLLEIERKLHKKAKVLFTFKKKIHLSRDIIQKERQEFELLSKEYSEKSVTLKANYDPNLVDAVIAYFKNEEGADSIYILTNHASERGKSANLYFSKRLKDFENENREHIMALIKKGNLGTIDFDVQSVSLGQEDYSIQKGIGIGLGGMILFLLLISCFNPAINTSIGERDSNTFKVLLMNPISMQEIFIGKYLNVAFQGLLTLLPYAFELLVFYAWGESKLIFSKLAVFTPLKLFTLFVGTISVASCISGLCFLTCSFSKTRQQAQSLMTILMFLIMVPIVYAGVFDLSLNSITAFIPLVNFTLMGEKLMIADPIYWQLWQSILVNFGVGLVLIWFSLNAFLVQWSGNTETKGLSDLLVFKRRKTNHLVPAHAFLAFVLCALGYAYGGVLFSALNESIVGHLLRPIFFGLGASLAVMIYSQLDFTKEFKWNNVLNKKTLVDILLACFLGFAVVLLRTLFKSNSDTTHLFPILFSETSFFSVLAQTIVFGIIATVCAEILFRGVIFKGLRAQYNLAISTTFSTLAFMLININSLHWSYNIFLGPILCYIHEKKGLSSAIIFHISFSVFIIIFAS